MVCFLCLRLFTHEENEVGARAHRPVRGGVCRGAFVIARILHADHRRAAAVQIERRLAAERFHHVCKIVKVHAGGVGRLVCRINDDGAIRLDANGGSGALLVPGVEREVFQRTFVFHQQVSAAAGIGNILPLVRAANRNGDAVSDLECLHVGKDACVARLFCNREDEAARGNGAGGGALRNFRDLQRHLARKRQFAVASRNGLEHKIVGGDGVFRRRVIIARVKSDAVGGCENLIIEDFRIAERAAGQQHMQVGACDDGAAVFEKADGIDIAARAQYAVRDNEAIGNAGRHVKERAVHTGNQTQVLIVQIRCDLAHGASSIECRPVDHHRLHIAAGLICKRVLLQNILRVCEYPARVGHFNQIYIVRQRNGEFGYGLPRSSRGGSGKQTHGQTKRERAGNNSFHRRPPFRLSRRKDQGVG